MDWDIEKLVDEALQPGESGWIRGDHGQYVWVTVNEDGSYTLGTPPPLNPPEDGKPIFI